MIDKIIRPLFHKDFKCETQVICTVLSYDFENQPDIIAMLGASAALTLSGIPFFGPIGAVRVSYKDKNFSINPKLSEIPESDLDLVVAGTKDGVLMVESEASELSEKIMLDAVDFGHKQMQVAIEAIIEFRNAEKEPRPLIEENTELVEIRKKLSTLKKKLKNHKN